MVERSVNAVGDDGLNSFWREMGRDTSSFEVPRRQTRPETDGQHTPQRPRERPANSQIYSRLQFA